MELTTKEQSWETYYQECGDRLSNLDTRRRILQDKKPRTLAENLQLSDLEKDLQAAKLSFRERLDQITREAGNSKGGDELNLAGLKDDRDLTATLGKLGPRTVAIYP